MMSLIAAARAAGIAVLLIDGRVRATERAGR